MEVGGKWELYEGFALLYADDVCLGPGRGFMIIIDISSLSLIHSVKLNMYNVSIAYMVWRVKINDNDIVQLQLMADPGASISGFSWSIYNILLALPAMQLHCHSPCANGFYTPACI